MTVDVSELGNDELVALEKRLQYEQKEVEETKDQYEALHPVDHSRRT